MNQLNRRVAGLAAAALLTVGLVACGSSSSSSGNSSSATTGSGTATTVAGNGKSTGGSTGGFAPGGTLQVGMGTSPDSLDPDYGYTTQEQEADWLVYLPMLTYAHKTGLAGTALIPALATALPVVTDGGKTYTMTMRKGLTFSDGTPVVASDFTYAIERSIKIEWGGDSFFTSYIVGAAAYQAGKATTISGIVTNNTTGQITIHLLSAYGAFDNVLAFVSAAPLPATTPMKVLSTTPPPGVGPYEITAVRPMVAFTLKKVPGFAKFAIPGIPTGYVNAVQVTIQSNNTTEAQNVIDNTSDEFDFGDTLPPADVSVVESKDADRYKAEPAAETDYFFFNTRTAPFDNYSAREAVNLALSRTSLARLASGQITPACYFLPPLIPGSVSGACPFGAPSDTGSPADITKATALVKAAGLAGTPVTVWSETRSPRQQYCTYLNSVLNQIGFKSTLKVIADSVYFQTIGSAKTNPQTGFADWAQDFPNPSDFYLLLSKAAIQPVNNENFGNVDDPHIEAALATLDASPATALTSVAPQWQALEKYVASKSYLAPFGNGVFPFFLSNRVDFATAIYNPVSGDDWSSFELKS
jgi:peptide/nickel transport system substrate-binding protein